MRELGCASRRLPALISGYFAKYCASIEVGPFNGSKKRHVANIANKRLLFRTAASFCRLVSSRHRIPLLVTASELMAETGLRVSQEKD